MDKELLENIAGNNHHAICSPSEKLRKEKIDDIKGKQNDNASVVIHKSTDKSEETNRLRKQSINKHNRSIARKPLPYSTPVALPKSNGHHSLVHMIGGAVSLAQSRGPPARSVPIHRVNERPKNLICGDAKPKQFVVSSIRSQACSCGGEEGLYELPCQHIFCRSCLLIQLPSNESKCYICTKTFKRSEIAKYHSKSMYS